MKVTIFDNDISTLNLLKLFLTNQGHQPQVHTEPFSCALDLFKGNQCPSDSPCADAMIINMRDPTAANLEVLVKRVAQGCKLTNSNKAIMSTCMSGPQEGAIRAMGIHTIKKPFRMADILGWLEQSALHLTE